MKTRVILAAVAMVLLVPGYGLAQAVVDVTLERDGDFITASVADDYSVEIAGAAVPVVSVSCEVKPLSLLVLVDLSFSATDGQLNAAWRSSSGTRFMDLGANGHDLPGLVDTIKSRLLRALGPDDRVRVGGFAGRKLRLSDRFTADLEEQRAAVDAVLTLEDIDASDRFGTSPIWDVVAHGVTRLSAEPRPRAVLLITNGHATGNRLGLLDVARLAAEAAVPVHAIFEPSWSQLEVAPYDEGDRLLRPLAELTGGIFRVDERLEQFSFWGSIPPSFGDILEAARHSCTLNLGRDASPGDEVSVNVPQPGAVVHAPRWLGAKDHATSE